MPDGNNILLELPLTESLITEQHFITVEQLKKRFGIVMAHPNRYSDFTVERIIKWMDRDRVYALGSDAHQKKGSYRRFNKAYKCLFPK